MAAIEYDVTIFWTTILADVCVLSDALWSVKQQLEEWLQWYEEMNLDTAGICIFIVILHLLCIASECQTSCFYLHCVGQSGS